MRSPTLAAALLLTIVGNPSFAQSPAEHQGHHLDQKEAPAAKEPAAPEPPRGAGSSQGMNRGGMTNMMGSNMSMSDMPRMMGMMRQSGDGMETIDHVEGRIAFLRTELKITDAQAPAWNAFADALRANAKALGELRTSMMSQAESGSETLVDRLSWQEKWLAARLEATRAMKSALINLVAGFSDEQKTTSDDLLAPQMGMMPMMSAMRSGAMMGMAMRPGKPMH
ncbi:hypothetical protein SSBR45G_55930 [Bradyrhizobium sp. SSBR45G]|uniref:Spy/CpxP family protein refolding chaperone n=1 Tax=unclassified Bradyrhizobium TaxID=2631580 RepID=UPI002342B0FE|nr:MULTISPECIES: Spy/CpxP family protein refolding chaperone [unclassified Bradyrhizobium]GLH80684.1 hypothetical protein SSBR45G_55930 [Bradyrhizobium sp. SSBR45G]GLH88073.1 hypothetical protein SSBR45R_55340 [Bradyrhizobium sp. SSBR45R]